MKSVTVRRQTDVSPESAWSAITAVESYPDMIDSYESVDLLTSGPPRLGARWRQTRSVFGRSHAQVLEVTEWDPPRSLVTTARESGAIYTTRYALVRRREGTEIEVSFEVGATNAVAALFQRLLGAKLLSATGEAMKRDLDDLVSSMHRRVASPTVDLVPPEESKN